MSISAEVNLTGVKDQINRRYYLLLILAIALITRLYNINAPILGIRGWRQADTMAMAINFHNNGYNILYPQIDWGGETAGYVESEFPVYSYLLGLTFAIFGVSEIAARLVSIVFSLISLIVFYFLVLDYTDERAAFWSSLFLGILPLNVFMGRVIMPESLLLLSLISGMYCFSRWLSTNHIKYFMGAAFFISLACLIKIPSLYIGLPLFWLASLKYGKKIFIEPMIWIFGIVVIGSVGAWYYHAHQIYLQSGLTFGIWEYGTDKWGNWDLVITWTYWKTILIDHLGEMFFVGAGYPIFFTGLLLYRERKEVLVFDHWLAGVIIYFFIVGRGNYIHDYYQLPFTIPAAVFLGKVFSKYFKRERPLAFTLLSTSLLSMLIFGAYNYNQTYMKSEDTINSESYELAQLTSQYSQEESLVITVDNGDPTILYLARRKGWRVNSSAELLENDLVDQGIERGAQFLVGKLDCSSEVQCTKLKAILAEHEILFVKNHYYIVRLSN